jgi:tartrate-resistant acid phosphatase type 5
MSAFLVSRRGVIAGAPIAIHLAGQPNQLFAQSAPRALSFSVIGDWGRDGEEKQIPVARILAKNAADRRSAFIASTGDNFYTFGVSSATDKKWDTSFEAIYTEPSVQVPWLAVLGNHDYGGSVEAQIARTSISPRWHLPSRWYSVSGARFGRPDVDLFFIDTVTWLGKESFPWRWLGDGITKGHQRAQIIWLSGALACSTARFKFVFGHHGIYSIGPHGGNMRMKELDDLLRANDVTAYINGHDHCLYHITRKGLHYICSGGGSQVLSTYTGGTGDGCVFDIFCDPEPDSNAFARWHYFLSDAGFAAFDVHHERVTFSLIGAEGQVYEGVI